MQSCHSSAAISALKEQLGQLGFTKLRCCGVFVAKQVFGAKDFSWGSKEAGCAGKSGLV